MSQKEVYNFLKENSPRDFDIKELMLNLNIKEQSIYNNLRRLLKFKEIKKEKRGKKTYYSFIRLNS